MQALHVPSGCDQFPSGNTLVDGYGRTINYLRLAVTDRCNLRCRYCMPEEGITSTRAADLLTFEEIIRLVQAAASCGVRKLRFTGGEPFVRRDFMQLLEAVHAVPGIESIHITSNGVAVGEHIARLQELAIAGINLSLDSLKPDRFAHITRRNVFSRVRQTLDGLLLSDIPLKINVVVQQGINTDEIADLAALAKSHPITVRFIEQMPFNGKGTVVSSHWDSQRILAELVKTYPAIHRSMNDSGTARLYTIPGFAGSIGIIGAYSRQFCASCNKIRVTPQGLLKTCLYDNGSLDLRALLRDEATTESRLARALARAVDDKPKNGYIAEKNSQGSHASMASIGG
jgi:cyclic pyranopterin phosphate synthase